MAESPLYATLNVFVQHLNQQQAQLRNSESMTSKEQQNLTAMSQAVEYLRSAMTLLRDPAPPEAETRDATPLEDGRYKGGNGELSIELRMDIGGLGIISADVFRIHASGETWVASLRTTPGVRALLSEGSWDIIGEDQRGTPTTGRLSLSLQLVEPLTLTGRLRLDQPLEGLPGQKDIGFTAIWISKALRSLGIEIEQEQDVADLPTYNFNGKPVTVESAFAEAGLEISAVGQHSTISHPPNPKGWGTTELHALMHDNVLEALVRELHALMQDSAQASVTRAAWENHLLLPVTE